MIQYFFKLRTLSAVLGLFLAVAASAQEKRQLTYATFYGANDFYETSARYFMDEVTRRSGGRITFQPYYGGSLLKTTEMSMGISKGAADIGSGVPAAFNPREFPLSGVVLPFITENPQAATRAFAQLYKENEDLQKEYQRNNQRLLWAIGSGENTIWTNKPIRSAEDLKGARIRAIIGVADAIMALGGTPISIPWVEALELVQRGGAEGVSGTPFNQAVATKVFDMAPYGSNGARMGVYTLVTWTINEKIWNAFDAETKRIFNDVAASVPDYYFSGYDKEIERTVELARAAAVQYVPIEESEAKRWRDIAQPVVNEKWLKQAQRSVNNPMALLARFTELVRQYEAEYPYTPGFDRLHAIAR